MACSVINEMQGVFDVILGHANIENTVRYLGVDVDDALPLSGRTDI